MTASTPAVPPALNARIIARFHLPLVLNAWLVTLVGPVLNAALGRSVEPRMQLAAFWLAFTVLLVSQSACLVLQQVTAAALKRREPLGAVALGAVLLGAASAALVLAVARTPLGDFVFRVAIPTPPRTAALARAVLAPMAIVPLLVALRGLAGGVAVTERRTPLIAAATLVRVLLLGAVATGVAVFHAGAGAVEAAWALVLATAAETVFVAAATLVYRTPSRAGPRSPAGAASLARIFRLALPLAAASLVWTAARPLVSAILGRLANPELAQAGFGVVLPILLVSCAPLWAFLDVTVVLPHGDADVRRILQFAAATSLAFALAIAAVTLTPLRGPALRLAFALPPELERAVLPALGLLALEPCILSARAITQGLLVRAGRGGVLLALSPVKLALMLAAGLSIARIAPHANGAGLALGLFIGGDVVDAVLYTVAVRRTGVPAIAGGASAPAREPAAGIHQEAA